MLAKTIARNTLSIHICRLSCQSGFLFATLLTIAVLWPMKGLCDLYVEFLVDRTGSMWAPFQGTAKIVLVAEAVERVTRELPPDVSMGLRVYPPLEKEGPDKDPGLLIPVDKENRDRFREEDGRLNPRGRGSLGRPLKRSLMDFPDGQDTKLLVLLTDGADTEGASFCENAPDLTRPEGLRFYVISLNLQDPSDQKELDCLSMHLEGESIHLGQRDNLASTLLPIAQKAYQDEVERQRSVAEEQRRMEELLSKTRLKVEIRNTLDPFFADSIQVEQCTLDGEKIPIDASVRLGQGENSLLFDKAMAEGIHRVSLRYRKWEDSKAVPSVEGILQVRVEEGKTTYVQCFPRGALFHWDFTFKTHTF